MVKKDTNDRKSYHTPQLQEWGTISANTKARGMTEENDFLKTGSMEILGNSSAPESRG